eukprot:INCI1841.1.p1 GENE.INCI1841.1~~INCI1841.1.p1  ORF type:complete len:813 (-),score=116.61 INCI1841.1:252-2690(-)
MSWPEEAASALLLLPAATTAAPQNASNFTTAAGGDVSLISAELLPALLNIFAVILLGYLVGSFKLLPREATRILSKTCGMLLLPVLLFCGLATIDFYSPVFEQLKVFLIGISIAKALVFAAVAVLCLITDRSPDRWGKAGIRGIFVTQQNDFSLGLPIFAALYQKTDPEFMFILFLAAPINLIILNPIAFTMMEYSNTQKQGKKFGCRTMLKIFLKVVRNPITWSAFLGLIVNFCTKGTLPAIIFSAPSGGLLGVVKAAFPFLSQFALGMVIVGKLKSMKPRYLPVPAILIFCKVFLLPIVGKSVVQLIGGTSSANEKLSAATFIYCAIPTTGGVFLYALQYGMSPHRIAIAMVMCTIISAPVLFIMAVLASVNGLTIEGFYHQLPQYAAVPCYVSLVGCAWYIVSSFWAYKRWANDTAVQRHIIMMVVLCSVVACSLGGICNGNVEIGDNATSLVLYHVRTGAQVAIFIWSAALAFFESFVLRRFTKLGTGGQKKYVITLIVTHICVWSYSAAAEAVLYHYTINSFICIRPWSEDTDLVKLGFLAVPFLVLAVGVIAISRHIGRLRRAVRSSMTAESAAQNQAAAREAVNALRSPLLEDSDHRSEDHAGEDSAGSSPPSPGPRRLSVSEQRRYEAEQNDPEAEAFRRLQTQMPEVAGSKTATYELHGTIARFVFVLYILVCLLCLVLALILHVLNKDNLVMIFEIRFLSDTLAALIGFVVCAIFGFHHHIVMKPLFAFLRRCCKCKCCGAVAADPGSFDPMWTTLPSPRKGGQGGRDASSGGGGTDDSELREPFLSDEEDEHGYRSNAVCM